MERAIQHQTSLGSKMAPRRTGKVHLRHSTESTKGTMENTTAKCQTARGVKTQQNYPSQLDQVLTMPIHI